MSNTHSPAEWTAYAAVATAIYTSGAALVVLCASRTRKQLREAAGHAAEIAHRGRHRAQTTHQTNTTRGDS